METFRYRYRIPSTEKGEYEGKNHDGIGDEQKRVFDRRLHLFAKPSDMRTSRVSMFFAAPFMRARKFVRPRSSTWVA